MDPSSEATQNPSEAVSGRRAAHSSSHVVLVAVFMGGLSFAAVPLYDIFCRVTGFGGTPARADCCAWRCRRRPHDPSVLRRQHASRSALAV